MIALPTVPPRALALGAGALLLLAAAVVVASRPNTPDGAREVVAPRDLVLTIKAVGDLVPKERRMVASSFSGKLDFLVAEGTEVKAGAVVARLATREITESLQEEELKLAMLKKDAETAALTAQRDLDKIATELAGARADLALKRLELKQLLAGTPTPELTDLKLKAEAAREAYAHAQRDHAVREGLLAKGILRPTEVAEHQVAVARAKKAFEVATAALSLAEAGYTDTAIGTQRLEVEKAENAVAIATARLRHERKLQALDRSLKQAELDDVAARVQWRKRRLASATLKAPGSGVVVLPAVWMNGNPKKVQVGDEVRRNAAFMEIADVSRVLVKTDIKETDIGRVKGGMPVSIRMEGLGERFSGKLAKLGVLAVEAKNLSNRDGAPRVFEAIIETAATSPAFKPGMTVDLEIETGRLEMALTVPHAALHVEAGETYVYVAKGGGASKRRVVTGPDDGDRTVIREGLAASDVVLLEKPQ